MLWMLEDKDATEFWHGIDCQLIIARRNRPKHKMCENIGGMREVKKFVRCIIQGNEEDKVVSHYLC